jgi:hypothetical protein
MVPNSFLESGGLPDIQEHRKRVGSLFVVPVHDRCGRANDVASDLDLACHVAKDAVQSLSLERFAVYADEDEFSALEGSGSHLCFAPVRNDKQPVRARSEMRPHSPPIVP